MEFDLQNLSIIEQHDLFTKSFTRDRRPATNWSASLASTSDRKFAQSGNYSQGIRLIWTAQPIRRIIAVSDPQQILPLAKVASLKPMLSATRNVEMGSARSARRTFRQFRTLADTPSGIDTGEKQIGRARQVPIGVGSAVYRESP